MKRIIALTGVLLLIWTCSTVPITERKRINIVSDAEILPASFAQYELFLKDNNLSGNTARQAEIREVGKRISASVDKFMRANNMTREADMYQWEFNLIEDKAVNAWCMPGGKVVFYTGILPICKDQDGIAAVMGHEIAHAFAKHGQERMTSAYGQQLGGVAVALGTAKEDKDRQKLWSTIYGVGSTVGMLAYSRLHESEADKLGMVFMTMAGYKPEACIAVWERMKTSAKGKTPPEFLSTHPSHDTRIERLTDYLPEARELAKKYR